MENSPPSLYEIAGYFHSSPEVKFGTIWPLLGELRSYISKKVGIEIEYY